MDSKRPLATEPAKVLLDHNHWIGLAKALRGSGSSEYEQLLCWFMEHRTAIVPVLSEHRYWEIQGTRKWKQRSDVAVVMRDLTGYRSILSTDGLMALEIRSLWTRHHEGADPGTPIFGRGVNHAMGYRFDFRIVGPPGASLPNELETALLGGVNAVYSELFEEEFEWKTLSALRLPQSMLDTHQIDQTRFERGERRFETRLRDHTASPQHEACIATTGLQFCDQILAEGEGLGCDHVDFRQLVDNLGWLGLVRAIPSLDILAELRYRKARNAQRPWVANDKHDVNMVRQGLPYCAVVAVDKFWASLLHQTNLPERYGCIVVAKPKDLLAALVSIEK